jgi:hypothetical protein
MTAWEMLELLQSATPGAMIVCRVDGFDEPGLEIEPNEVVDTGDVVYLDFCRKLSTEEDE